MSNREWAEKAQLASIRLHTPDIVDGQVWVQSSINPTHRMQRGTKEDFSFTNTDLLILPNRGEDYATLRVEVIAAPPTGIYVGSNRRAGMTLRAGETYTIRMRPGETITMRNTSAVEPHTGANIRAGQSVILG